MYYKIAIFFFWLFIQNNATAQSSWEINFNYSQRTSVDYCIEDDSRALIVAGIYGDDYDHRGFFIARADAAGNLLWSDSSSCEKVTLAGVVRMPDSSFLMAVAMHHRPAVLQGTVVGSGPGFYTTLVVRYDKTGNILSYNKFDHCYTKRILATSSGSIILYGSFSDSAAFNGNFPLGKLGLFLAIADKDLNVQHAKQIGNWQEIDVCALGLNGQIYAGVMDSNSYAIKRYDLFLTEYPNLWTWTVSRPEVNVDGKYILTDQSSISYVDSNGSITWTKNLSMSGFPQTFVNFPQDRVYCATGYSLSSGEVGTDISSLALQDAKEYFIWRLNNVSARPFNGVDNITYAYGEAMVGPLLSVGTLIRREAISTSVHSAETMQWQISPIPASENLSIKTVPQVQSFELSLFSITGEPMFIGEMNYGNKLDVSALNPGVYILVIQIGVDKKVFKIIKE
jgi:hypothetical protein